MKILERTDRSIFGMWWWTVDHKLIGMLFLLIIGGIMILMSAGSPIAVNKLNLEPNYFLNKQLIFLSVSAPSMLFISMLSSVQIRRFALLGLVICSIGMMYANFFGNDIKGATRWITIYGFTIQPSEFAKPCFAVVNAWILSLWLEEKSFNGWIYSVSLLIILISILLFQPDVGMSFVIAMTWIFQIFLAGISITVFSIISAFILLIGFICFACLEHVQLRVKTFLSGEGLQIEKSIEAFKNGGLFGQGFNESTVSIYLPDSHSDFIFSVAGEELGILGAGIIIFAYVLIFWRGIILSSTSNKIFIILASSSLIFQFCFQSAIHMASTLNMIPTKGMTLPFISYGGSSLLSSCISMGIVLAMTRKHLNWNNK